MRLLGKMGNRGRSNPQTKKPSAGKSSSDESQPKLTHNVVYQELVANDEDIVGQLAYCLYKQSKQRYLQTFEAKADRRPTDDEVRTHVECAEIPALDIYRGKAKLMVEELLAQAAQEKQDELEAHFKDRLWRFINRHEHEGFIERSWHSIKSLGFGGLGGVVGNIFTTILVFLTLFMAASNASREEFSKSAKESFISGMAEIIGVGVTIKNGAGPNAPLPPPSNAPPP